MARSAINYLRLLQSLLPKGWAWNRDEDSGLTQFLYGLSDELARMDARSTVLLSERDTRYTSELLVDHENDLGLPDECSLEDLTITERREVAHSKLIALGQQNPGYFIELAAAYGWIISITEYTPFWSGIGASGDPAGNQDVIFYWKISVEYGGGAIVYAISGDAESGDLITVRRDASTMVCTLNKYKPAHTMIIWEYESPPFDRSFSSAFDAIPSWDTTYLEGAFMPAFSSAFDVRFGGDYGFDEFSTDFRKSV